MILHDHPGIGWYRRLNNDLWPVRSQSVFHWNNVLSDVFSILIFRRISRKWFSLRPLSIILTDHPGSGRYRRLNNDKWPVRSQSVLHWNKVLSGVCSMRRHLSYTVFSSGFASRHLEFLHLPPVSPQLRMYCEHRPGGGNVLSLKNFRATWFQRNPETPHAVITRLVSSPIAPVVKSPTSCA